MLKLVRSCCSIVLAVAVTTTGCGGDSDPTTARAPEPVRADDSSTTGAGTDSEDATQPSATSTPTPESVAAPTATPEPANPYVRVGSSSTIEQLTPETGNEPYPTLTWSPVDGAAEYSVIVYHPDGEPWWGWYGTSPEVTLGGVDGAADIGGPRAIAGTTWIVVAHDADGLLVGSSPRRPVTP